MIEQAKYLFNVGNRIKNQFEVYQREEGGMGVVYLCYDHLNNCIRALKTFHRYLLNNEFAIEQFISEALIWIKLGKHKNIVEAQSVEKIAGQPYLFLECIVGKNNNPTLRSFLKGHPLNFNLSLNFSVQFCMGMSYANSRIPGIIHRDIKPQNVLINNDETLKICDFGLAKVHKLDTLEQITKPSKKQINIKETQQGKILGTIAYMAPEQIESRKLKTTSDIYSFGLVLYEMFTGRHPFLPSTAEECIKKHLYGQPERPRKIIPNIPMKVEEIIMKCLEKRPENRFLDFNELMNAIIGIQPSLKNLLNEKSSFIDSEIEGYVNKVHSLFNLGFQTEAFKLVNDGIKKYPNSPDLWSNKGVLLAKKERRVKAIKAYDTALKIKPKYIEALSNKAASLCKLNRYNMALECTKSIIKIDESNVNAWVNQGVAFLGLLDWNSAIESLNHANTLDPWIPNSWNNLAVAVYPLQYFKNSKKTIIPLNKSSPFIFEDLNESISFCLRALSIDPNHTPAEENLKIKFRHAIEQLPASSVCEPLIWQVASRNDYQEMFFTRVIGKGKVKLELHPKYLAEIQIFAIALLQNTQLILREISHLIAIRLVHSPIHVIEETTNNISLRFCLHGLNEILIKLGLLELPFTTAAVLSKQLNSISLGEQFQIAKSMNDTGIIYRQLKKYDKSLKCYAIALPIYKNAQDFRYVGNVQYNQGCVYEFRNLDNDKQRALEHFKIALDTFKNIKDDKGIRDSQAKIKSLL